jgi:hypothetical protein
MFSEVARNFFYFSLFFTFINICTTEPTPIGCILWRNTFLKIDNKTNSPTNQVLQFTLHSRQSNGWIGITFSPNPNDFENSTSILGYLPNQFLQLKNHTAVSKKIFSEIFVNSWQNSIDGIFSFAFSMNVSDFSNSKYFYFSINKNQQPFNDTIPKHELMSDEIYFDISILKPIPNCVPELNIASRIPSQHIASLILISFFYVVIAVLFLIFKDDQPFRSRYVGPFLAIASLYGNLFIEYIYVYLPFEITSRYYCIITAVARILVEIS